MADRTKIEWCKSADGTPGATWNPITGCTLVSEGCRNCYAAHLAATRLKHHPSREGLATVNADGVAKFTGKVRFNEQWLDQPLRWQKPRMIFVCAHSDLFHEAVPDEWIDRVFAVMALAQRHTFQVLTKRPGRMAAYIERTGRDIDFLEANARRMGFSLKFDGIGLVSWPLSNVWLGTSVEDQATANERVPRLIETPAAVRFISAEPLLGPVDLSPWLPGSYECSHLCGWRGREPTEERCHNCGERGSYIGEDCRKCRSDDIICICPECDSDCVTYHPDTINLDWVIAGGESGKNARPMHPDWVRSLRDQCRAAGVAFHFKQWGEWVSVSEVEGPGCHYSFPDGATVRKVGKKAAGRLLDGRTWDEFPQVGKAAP